MGVITMINVNSSSVNAMNALLNKIDYVFIIKNLKGLSEFVDPWADFERMEKLIEKNVNDNKDLIKLFCLGIPAPKESIKDKELLDYIDVLIMANVLIDQGISFGTDNYCVVVYQGMKFLTEINPWYATCKNKDTDIYIGLDSLRLAENIKFDTNQTVLDLCSGTGIQGILAARSAKKVVSVELNHKAATVIEFNAKLNGLSNKIEIREGDLFSVINDNERFTNVYVNPPFIPIVQDVAYPICGAGGEDGMQILTKIVDNLDRHLEDDGESIIFCQCLGDNNSIFFDKYLNDSGKLYSWSVKTLVIDKVPANYQIDMLGKLTSLFNEGLDLQSFKSRMQQVYSKLNASYLYSIIYKIRKNECFSFTKFVLTNKWGLEDSAIAKRNIVFKRDDTSFAVYKDDVRIGYVDAEAKLLYEVLQSGHSLQETISSFPEKIQDSAFSCKVLQMCNQMEELGIIERAGN